MRWLITGGCGFIGRSLISKLVEYEVPLGHIRVLDNLKVGTESDLRNVVNGAVADNRDWSAEGKELCLIRGDIRQRSDVLRAVTGCDVVVHLAACTGVQPSVEDPHSDAEVNVLGTLNCLDAARLRGVSRFVLASSGAPLGEVEPPIHEKILPKPISPYGASKLAAEAYCSVYKACFKLDTVSLRFGNVYGPLSSRKESVVARFIKRALSGDDLEIYGDGTATRDYIFSEDLVEAIILSARKSDVGGEVFQIATNRETTVKELVEQLLIVLREFGIQQVEIRHSDARAGDMPRNYSDTSKAREILGWVPNTSLKEGLKTTVKWFLEQESKGSR